MRHPLKRPAAGLLAGCMLLAGLCACKPQAAAADPSPSLSAQPASPEPSIQPASPEPSTPPASPQPSIQPVATKPSPPWPTPSVEPVSPEPTPRPEDVLLGIGLTQEEAEEVLALLETYAAARSLAASGQSPGQPAQVSAQVMAVTQDWADYIRQDWEEGGIYFNQVDCAFTQISAARWDVSGELRLIASEWLTIGYSRDPEGPAIDEMGMGGEHTILLARDSQGGFTIVRDVYPDLGSSAGVWTTYFGS